MKQILLLSFILLAAGCATKTIKVVDAQGKAVKGALVVSEELPYIMQSWKLAAYITDNKGEAKIVSNRGHIFKSGYFPVIDSSELQNSYLWKAPSLFSNTIIIYPIKLKQKTTVNISSHITMETNKDGNFDIPLEACNKIRVTYNVNTSRLKAQSKKVGFLSSKRFYFVGPDTSQEVSTIDRENNLAFYCNENNGLYKVGVSVAAKVWQKGIPRHKLTIFSAKVSNINEYIQPVIKCASSEDIRIFRSSRKVKPDMYISSNLKESINEYRSTIPCPNAYTGDLIDYIEDFL